MSYNDRRVHFDWSTPGRRNLIRDEIQADLYAYIGGILRKRDHVLLAAGGVADHIHLLFAMHQSQSVASVMEYISNQAEHHQTVSYQDEFLAFLRKNGIEFDR